MEEKALRVKRTVINYKMGDLPQISTMYIILILILIFKNNYSLTTSIGLRIERDSYNDLE
jgi:hypothetical protein